MNLPRSLILTVLFKTKNNLTYLRHKSSTEKNQNIKINSKPASKHNLHENFQNNSVTINILPFNDDDVPFFSPELVNRAFYTAHIQSGRCSHKAKQFRKVTHCIFDLDGTILDSEVMYHKVLRELCGRYGKQYTKDFEMRIRGGTDKAICAFLIKEMNINVSPAKFERELEDISQRRLPKAPLQKGAERLLYHLHDTGIPFGLATNSTRRAVRAHMASKPKLFSLFQHITCANDSDVDRGKPHPDIYLVAASKFPENPKPFQCLVFEDSVTGLEAGIGAGMQVVMIPQFRLPPQISRKATVVLRTLQDFRPEYFGLPPFTDQPIFPRKPK